MLKSDPLTVPQDDNRKLDLPLENPPRSSQDGSPMTRPNASSPCLDPLALARLQELDPSGANKLIERVVAAYLKALERMLPELDKARVEPMDLNVVRHISHTLKSSSASLGALDLAERCAAIETMARLGQTEDMSTLLDGMLEQIAVVRQALLDLSPDPT
jgi:HPt (histidine-containing phosphotransfer) domain-containing protein